jgi:hypothetical protein
MYEKSLNSNTFDAVILAYMNTERGPLGLTSDILAVSELDQLGGKKAIAPIDSRPDIRVHYS